MRKSFRKDILQKSLIRISKITAVSFLCCAMTAYAGGGNMTGNELTLPSVAQQQSKVSGVILDENGDPIIGANVVVKGTTRGVITDIDGAFTIDVAPNETLQISYVGFLPQEIALNGRTSLNIQLKEDAQALEEVVVVGYGVQKKSVVTAAVSRVDSEDLMKNNPTDMRYALQGKVSGVQITSNSGQPGSEAVFRVRGIGTINDNTPLYLVDGFPAETNVINTLNPSDISSVEVLKDAASAAIYGARAANGVILITTKEGQKGKVRVSYDFTYGIQNLIKKMDVMNAVQYQNIINEAYENAGQTGPFSNPNVSAADTDWQDLVLNKNAPMLNHQLSVSGGTDDINYYLSLGILNQEGLIAKGKSDYDRYNFRANTNMKVYETNSRNFLNKVTLGANIAFETSTTHGIDANNEFGGVIGSAIMAPPNIAPYVDDQATIAEYDKIYPNYVKDKNGRVYSVINNLNEVTNPLATIDVRHQSHKKQSFQGNFNLNIHLLPGLTFKTSLGGRYGYEQERSWDPVYYLSSYRHKENSEIYQQKRDAFRWQWENVLSYSQTFGSVHNVSAILGTSAMKNQWEWMNGRDYDLIAENDDKAYINSATGDRAGERVEASMENHALASVFGRVGYNYDEKYIVEATLRRDGSSNFAPNKRYAYFPSASVGWVFTREGFMEPVTNWLNFAKLRFSWGQNGNENIGAFNYTSTMYSSGEAATFGTGKNVMSGMRPRRLANPELTWETSEQIDLGIDLRLFNSALTVTFDYFDKKTKDMLMTLPIPNYVGNSAPYGNVGTMNNKGFELELGYKWKIGRVNMYTNGNVSRIKNKVTDIGEDRTITGSNRWNNQDVTRTENGYPFRYFYGLIADGIFRSEEEVLAHTNGKGEVLQPNAKPGDLRFRNMDEDDDGVINNNDRAFIGQSNPDWVYGLTLGADWNGFDFSMFFQGQAGNDIYDGTRRHEVSLVNFQTRYMDRFHAQNNPNGNYPRVTIQDTNNNSRINSFFLHDGSFVRLKNIQLGYTLPRHLLNTLTLSNVRIYAAVENALTITKYKGFDPEVGNSDGIDKGNYPQPRTVTFGLNVTF